MNDMGLVHIIFFVASLFISLFMIIWGIIVEVIYHYMDG